ncbi:hypothetical protein D3C80_140110 [compost metagenome]
MQLDEADIFSGIILRFRKTIACLRAFVAHQYRVHGEVKAAIAAGDLAHDGIVKERHIAADNGQNRYRNVPRRNALHLGDADVRNLSRPVRKCLETVGRARRQHLCGIIFYIVRTCPSIKNTWIKKLDIFGNCLLARFFDLFFAFWIVSIAHLTWIPPKITL